MNIYEVKSTSNRVADKTDKVRPSGQGNPRGREDTLENQGQRNYHGWTCTSGAEKAGSPARQQENLE